jgi:MtN3 and saliva related transmembrane protein
MKNINIFLINFFGVIAFITSMIGVLPQIYKSFKTKSCSDVSMLMMINFFICSFSWLFYGILTKSLYVILSNIFGSFITFFAILQKMHYDKKTKK